MSRPYLGESECEWLGITCPDDCAMVTADDYTPDPEPIHCAGCHDTQVDAPGRVCTYCRESDPADWVSIAAYAKMMASALKMPAEEMTSERISH